MPMNEKRKVVFPIFWAATAFPETGTGRGSHFRSAAKAGRKINSKKTRVICFIR
jgi:hypothetical protein